MAKILQLKIRVEEIKPPIWRRFLVKEDITFEKLHEIIQELMDWDNYHLYEFNVNNISIALDEDEGFNPAEGILNQLKNSPEFTKLLEQQDLSKGGVTLDVKKVNKILQEANKKKITKEKSGVNIIISKIINQEKLKFSYYYDFGDNWENIIVVEKILEEEPNKKYPVCIDGARAGPPEDCGGVWGYEELMEIQKDKNHPDYEERIVEWLGEDFDFEEFDMNKINEKL